MIALAAAHAYFTVDDILEEAASRGEAPLIVICDELSDPHNLAPSSGAPNARAPMASSSPSAAAWA